MNEKENEKVTRRKFLEDSSRKALGGTAAAFLGLSMIEPKTVHAEHCWFGCAGGCDGCTASCTGKCALDCTNECPGGCTGTLEKVAIEVECGTPVEERTSSARRVIV